MCSDIYRPIGPVHQLIAVDRRGEHLDGQRGILDGLEPDRHLAKVEVNVRNYLTGLHGDGVEGRRNSRCWSEVGGQHPVTAVVGLIENAVIEPVL